MTNENLIPEEIVWLSKRQLRVVCGKSKATVDRYLHWIRKLNPEGFDYEERQRGISRNSAIIVAVFNELVEQRGYVKALETLNNELQRRGINSEYRETESSN